MKNLVYFFLVVLLVCGCKKNSPTVVGHWLVTGINITQIFTYDTTLYTYNNATGILTQTRADTILSTTNIKVQLDLNNDGSAIVNQSNDSLPNYIQTNTGNWYYSGSGSGNYALQLVGLENSFFGVGSTSPDMFKVSNLTKHGVTLSFVGSILVTNPYSLNYYKAVYTLSR